MCSKRFDSNFQNLIGDFSIKYKDTPHSPVPCVHVHDAYEMTLILSDDVEVFINDTSYPVPYGSLLLFNPMDAHRIKYNGDNSYRRYVIWFTQEFMSELGLMLYKLLRCFFLRGFDKANLLRLSEAQLEETIGFCDRLTAFTKKRFMKKERLTLALGEFLAFVNDMFFTKNTANLPDMHNDYVSVYKAILYIQENFSGEITRQTLSTLTGLSERSLCEYFKNVTGMTTNQFILNFRLSVAKSLLLKDIQTAMVAEKCGFDNYSNFSRTFKKHVGLSPKQYAMKYTARLNK